MEPPRETISLLMTSIVGGLALTNGVTAIQQTLSSTGLEIPLYSIALFVVFVSVWLRFLPGNLSHIRKLERWPTTSVNTWLLDLSVITIEGMIIVFMAEPSVNSPDMFFYSLLVLLFLDIGWLASMIHGVRAKTRPEPQWWWLWINIPSIAVIVAFGIFNLTYPTFQILTSVAGLMIFAGVFVTCACVDIFKSVSDWYGRPRPSSVEQPERQEYEKKMQEAITEAKTSLSENGMPIGAVLVETGNTIARGHNRRLQDQNPMAHAEIECLKNAQLRKSYRDVTLFSTLMPCCLCAGAIVHCGIKRVVVGDAKNFEGARSFLEDCGVELIILDVKECKEMLSKYIKSNKRIWREDSGQTLSR
jgi:cytosine deaminase